MIYTTRPGRTGVTVRIQYTGRGRRRDNTTKGRSAQAPRRRPFPREPAFRQRSSRSGPSSSRTGISNPCARARASAASSRARWAASRRARLVAGQAQEVGALVQQPRPRRDAPRLRQDVRGRGGIQSRHHLRQRPQQLALGVVQRLQGFVHLAAVLEPQHARQHRAQLRSSRSSQSSREEMGMEATPLRLRAASRRVDRRAAGASLARSAHAAPAPNSAVSSH